MTVYTTLPTDDENLEVTVTDDPDLVVLNITPASVSGISVTTVNTQSGEVVLDTDDVQEDGSPTNKYFTDARAQTVITANSEGFIKADTTNTLTNKSGNISQWTNDSGYITSASEDDQTLSFSSPDLTISSGNTVDLTALKYTDADVNSHLNTSLATAYEVLTWSGTDWEWSSVTTINNNAEDRIITGSGTASTLEGEADFTWDGNNAVIDGTASNLTTPVLNLKTDNTNWNAAQLMCTDSNGNVFSQVGQLNTSAEAYVWNITLDPDNTHGRTGVTSYAGDYYVDFRKEYDDQSAIKITHNVYGANDGYIVRVKDDWNSGGGNQYDYKPMDVEAEHFRVKARDGVRSVATALTVDNTKADFRVPAKLVELTSTERDALTGENGMMIYNATEDRIEYYDGAWKYISGSAV